MYIDHFNLSRNPFPSTPQLDFYFDGGGRDAAIDAIDLALQENFGIIKIIGQIGCGKTMLCRQAYRQLADKYDVLFISDPSLDSCESILTAVASELNPEWDLSKPKNKLFQQIMQTLVKQHQSNKPTILLIEEAQKMTSEQFEELRYLTNLETSQDKLIQIVLFGQPSLDANLLKTDAQLLSSRLVHSIFLKPLSLSEFTRYVEHRLAVAGARQADTLFSQTQIFLTYMLANGSLRRANQLLEKTLFSSYINKRQQPAFRDFTAAARSMSYVGAQCRYTRGQLASVFSLGIFFGWMAFTATTPLSITSAQSAQTSITPQQKLSRLQWFLKED